ncbi:MAG: hypothetical protein WCF16_10025 [Alphaproteobacteria bacterium]
MPQPSDERKRFLESFAPKAVEFAAKQSGYQAPSGAKPVIAFSDKPVVDRQGNELTAYSTSGIIMLTPKWRPDLAGQAALVHEITHWLQDKAGKAKDKASWPELERQGYAARDAYYRSMGFEPPAMTPAQTGATGGR